MKRIEKAHVYCYPRLNDGVYTVSVDALKGVNFYCETTDIDYINVDYANRGDTYIIANLRQLAFTNNNGSYRVPLVIMGASIFENSNKKIGISINLMNVTNSQVVAYGTGSSTSKPSVLCDLIVIRR